MTAMRGNNIPIAALFLAIGARDEEIDPAVQIILTSTIGSTYAEVVQQVRDALALYRLETGAEAADPLLVAAGLLAWTAPEPRMDQSPPDYYVSLVTHRLARALELAAQARMA